MSSPSGAVMRAAGGRCSPAPPHTYTPASPRGGGILTVTLTSEEESLTRKTSSLSSYNHYGSLTQLLLIHVTLK